MFVLNFSLFHRAEEMLGARFEEGKSLDSFKGLVFDGNLPATRSLATLQLHYLGHHVFPGALRWLLDHLP